MSSGTTQKIQLLTLTQVMLNQVLDTSAYIDSNFGGRNALYA